MTIREDFAGKPIEGVEDWYPLGEALRADAEAQVAAAGLTFMKYLPNMFKFACVVANADNTKWIHVTTADARTEPAWMDKVSVRRMSSERDWKGDAFHYCTWEGLSEALTEYMGDQYDEEVL